MIINFSNVVFSNGKAKMTRECPICGKIQTLVADEKMFKEGILKYNGGMLIQNAFPFLTPSDRELMMTGICDECWNNM